ncbi:MAG TPA: hypothetical protein VFC82_10805 [Actinomycetaceae bacterium]|nr:hypothetical protein [Actinomycetaceae bacterium]
MSGNPEEPSADFLDDGTTEQPLHDGTTEQPPDVEAAAVVEEREDSAAARSETSPSNSETSPSKRGRRRSDAVAGMILLIAALVLLPFVGLLMVWQIPRFIWAGLGVGVAWIALFTFSVWVLSRGMRKKT